jgi:outer membrane protein OmpA-like peptidoglycan-associated protein
MLKYFRPKSVIITIFSFILSSIQVFSQDAPAAGKTNFEKALQNYSVQTNGENGEAVAAFLGMARIYAAEEYSGFHPDTAYQLLLNAQKIFRKLPKSAQKKLEKQGAGNSELIRFKSEIREKALAYALIQEDSEALNNYLESYGRLNQKLKKEAIDARNRQAFQEVKQINSYDSLAIFLERYGSEVKEFSPELTPLVEDLAYKLYFQTKDSSNIEHLLQLLETFPNLAGRLDDKIAQAFHKTPYVDWIEERLKGFSKVRMPQTVRAVFEYYRIEGDLKDLLTFGRKYPEFAEVFDLEQELAIARMSPDLGLAYDPQREELYDAYIRAAAPRHQALVALQKMIAEDIRLRQWETALAKVKKYQQAFGEDNKIISGLMEILAGPDYDIQAIDLGSGINSGDAEYSPVISADGKLLYFCRQKETEDVYVSRFENGNWGKASPLIEINRELENEAPLNISTDGATLLLFQEGQVKSADKEIHGWSMPRLFFPDDHISTWQGGSTISADRQAVIFAARRPDMVGLHKKENIDLFVSVRQSDGSWSPPWNLGLVINTPFEDRSPFLHPDMRTLYFSSRGHGGLGSLDVFKTTRVGDGWTEWTEPVNLGKEINTSGRDWGYKISTDGATAYFSMDVPDKQADIFRIRLPEELRPQQVSIIAGAVTNTRNEPIQAEILIEDLDTGKQIGIVRPDPQTGDFFVTLPSGKRYSYIVRADGYFPKSDHIDLSNAHTTVEVQTDIQVPSISEMVEENLALPLENLFFDTDESAIKPESFPELDRLAEIVLEFNLHLEISGHTDNAGTQTYNLELSRNRAEAARQYLINQGCPSERITARGYGMTQPIDSNATEAGRARNRRVEIRLSK